MNAPNEPPTGCFTKSSSAMAACPEAAEKMDLHLQKTPHPLTCTHSLAWNAEKRIFSQRVNEQRMSARLPAPGYFHFPQKAT